MYSSNRKTILVALLVLSLPISACVSTSLEDAAPTSLSIASPTNLQEPDTNALSAENIAATSAAQTPDASSNSTSSVANTEQAVVIPDAPTDETFPSFAQTPRGAVGQLTKQEEIAIEERMTQLLLARSKDPKKIANYKARLAYLRKLAATHAKNTENEILNNSGS